jgi:glycosyltransferase involved in cell wall biosynthesis
MNVIIICESARITGGAERVAVLEALEFRRRGIRVGFIAADPIADPRLAEAGVELLLIPAKSVFEESDNQKRLHMLFSNPYVVEPVREFLVNFEPGATVVHIHSFRLKLTGAPIALAQSLGFKTAFHCNEYATICPTSLYFNHRTQTNCDLSPLSLGCISCECQGQKWRHKLPKLTAHFGNKVLLKLYARADLFLAVSQLNAKTLAPHLPKQPVIVNYPHDYPQPEDRGDNDGNEFAFIGRLVPEKAPDTFLEAAKLAGVKAVVIGGGPMEESLRQKHPEARFTGWLSDAPLKAEMKRIRALVIPSRWRETFGLSVVDAIHRGIPVISTTSVGASEVVRESGAGIVTEEITPNSIAEAMNALNQPQQWSEMRANALAWSASNPRSTEQYVDRLIELFTPLIK